MILLFIHERKLHSGRAHASRPGFKQNVAGTGRTREEGDDDLGRRNVLESGHHVNPTYPHMDHVFNTLTQIIPPHHHHSTPSTIPHPGGQACDLWGGGGKGRRFWGGVVGWLGVFLDRGGFDGGFGGSFDGGFER